MAPVARKRFLAGTRSAPKFGRQSCKNAAPLVEAWMHPVLWRALKTVAPPRVKSGAGPLGRAAARPVPPQKTACTPTFRLRPGSGAFGNAVVVSTEVAL